MLSVTSKLQNGMNKSYETSLYYNTDLPFAASKPFTVSIFKKLSCYLGELSYLLLLPLQKECFRGYTGISLLGHSCKTV